MSIDELRRQWSEILNCLEQNNRIAWIAFFDARLAGIENSTVKLDFSDVRKFANPLEYSQVREVHRKALQNAIYEVTGEIVAVEELQ